MDSKKRKNTNTPLSPKRSSTKDFFKRQLSNNQIKNIHDNNSSRGRIENFKKRFGSLENFFEKYLFINPKNLNNYKLQNKIFINNKVSKIKEIKRHFNKLKGKKNKNMNDESSMILLSRILHKIVLSNSNNNNNNNFRNILKELERSPSHKIYVKLYNSSIKK